MFNEWYLDRKDEIPINQVPNLKLVWEQLEDEGVDPFVIMKTFEILRAIYLN